LLEAIYLNVPVVCSIATSLPETICDKRFTFDPESLKELSKLILDMLDNSTLRKENIENSIVRIIV